MSKTEEYRISYFITSEHEVKDMKILMESSVVQRRFKDIKESRKFINDMMKFSEKNNSFFHYNFEELQSVLLESRGKITRDNEPKTKVTDGISKENV